MTHLDVYLEGGVPGVSPHVSFADSPLAVHLVTLHCVRIMCVNKLSQLTAVVRAEARNAEK